MKGDNHDRYSLLTMNAGKEALIRKKIKLLQQTKTPLRPPSWIEDSSLRMLSIGYLLSSADQCVLQSHILFKMASSNRVTNTSLSLTLPISCQICLGKVNLSNLDTRQLSRVVLFDSQLCLLCFIRSRNRLSVPINMYFVLLVWTFGYVQITTVRRVGRRSLMTSPARKYQVSRIFVFVIQSRLCENQGNEKMKLCAFAE